MRGMAKERPTSRLLANRGELVRRGGFGNDLKWLRDLTEDKPESRDLTPMPLHCLESQNQNNGSGSRDSNER